MISLCGPIDESIREKGHKVDPDYKRGIVESHFWVKSETGLLGYVSFVAILVLSVLVPFIKSITNKDPLPGVDVGHRLVLLQQLRSKHIEHTLVNYALHVGAPHRLIIVTHGVISL